MCLCRDLLHSENATDVDILIDKVDPTPVDYERFVESIPCDKKQYMNNPFDSTTLDTGNELLSKMAAENKRRWEEMITSTDLTGNSRKACQTIREISNDPTARKLPCLVTANCDVLVEQLNNLGPQAHRWLHSMVNVCFTEKRIPKVWRQSKSDIEELQTYIPPMAHV